MNKRLLNVSTLFAIVLLGLLWGRFGQGSSQAAARAAVLDVPFFSQTALRSQTVSNEHSERLGNSDLLLWEYGCGVASLAMVYRQYGVDTDLTRLNDALRASGGFASGLLAWDKTAAFLQAGAPWVKGIERINTTQPQDYQERIDTALENGEPVIAYLNGQHYVVIVGKEGDNYRINDPWAVTEETGKGIALDKNLLAKGGFDGIRQLVFVSRQEYAPSNGVLVQGAIRDKYIASRGAQGPLGNPLQPQESLTGGGVWQRFENGAIFAPADAKPTLLFGPLWEKFQAEGGAAKLGLPRNDVYSYFVGPAVEWRADFADASILWMEGERPNQARVIGATNGIRAEYFANPNLSGQAAYTRFEAEEPLFDWGEGAPGPWVDMDNFSVRFTQTFAVGGLGWWYNFVVDADDGVRVKIDGKTLLDAWNSGPEVHKFRSRLGRGEHTLVIDYRERSGPARLRFARSDWPATAVFAAEETGGSFETLPVSVASSLPDLGTPIAQATAAAAGVIATLTAEANAPARPGSTPTPDNAVADAARANFESWAAANGEPFRDAQINVTENDGFFASAQVIAWFRPGRAAPWEEREDSIECRQVGGEWQCDTYFAFALTQGEQARRAQAAATVVAQSTATAAAQATATATATAIAVARATAVANMPAALQNVYDRFGLEFVLVPAGEFAMGSTEAEVDAAVALCNQTNGSCERARFENETPQHTVTLDAFWIARTEVTNVQWRTFIEAGGYAQKRYWTAEGWAWRTGNNITAPGCWNDSVFSGADHPVVCVSWDEAVAYTRWLSEESGVSVRLPSEAEWEKAARGTDGRIYPWGNETPNDRRLNYNTDRATPVGSYPDDTSLYGALDMAGNVWEWTGSRYVGYPYRTEDGREDAAGSDVRVVRGGSWRSDEDDVRSAVRHGEQPRHRVNDVGFRVVWSASVHVP